MRTCLRDTRTLACLLLLTAACIGCGGSSDRPANDGGLSDSGSADASTSDAPPVDAISVDSPDGTADAVSVDASAVDGAIDATTSDGALDGAALDASTDATTTFPTLGCTGVADGNMCPSGFDPSQRCYAGSCIGTFVAPPPVGNDAYPGTKLHPKATINAAKANAVLFNFVAPIVLGCNGDDPSFHMVCQFNEDLTVPAGLSIVGNYRRNSSGTWTQDGSRGTQILPTSFDGVRIEDSATTYSTELRNLDILGPANQNGNTVAVTIANGARPFLSHVRVLAGNATQGDSIGISILNNAGPWIDRSESHGGTAPQGSSIGIFASGRGTGPINSIRLEMSTFEGFSADISVGIEAHEVAIEASQNSILGAVHGSATTLSRALSCENCSTLHMSDNELNGGIAPVAEGIYVSGNTDEVAIDRNQISGGFSGSSSATDIRTGIVFSNCVGRLAQVSRSTVDGARGSSLAGGTATREARGIVAENCGVLVENANAISGAINTGAALHTVVDTVGITCDAQSECVIRNNTFVIGAGSGNISATDTTVGVRLEGRGLVNGLSAAAPQIIEAGAGVHGVAIQIDSAQALQNPPTISQNTILAVPKNMTPGMTSLGISVRGKARIENNQIRVESATVLNEGILLHAAPESVGAAFVNNTLRISGVSSSVSHGFSITSAVAGSPPSGTLLNNAIQISGAIGSAGVYEDASSADFLRLANNNIETFGSPLYIDEGVTSLSAITLVNALTAPGGGSAASGNISASWMIDGQGHHLPGSPNIDAGALSISTVMAPRVDFEGTMRVAPIDIGADEF